MTDTESPSDELSGQPSNGDPYFSVRMRAEANHGHLGGAERLVRQIDWLEAVQEMAARAKSYPGLRRVRITSDLVEAGEIHRTRALSIHTLPAENVDGARRQARQILQSAGVSSGAAILAVEALDRGPGPGDSVMRGGMIIDAETGDRLDPDPARGVRASRMDYTAECRQAALEWLGQHGLFSHRTPEAVAVATKAAWSGAIAEICWSDDPDYVAGYVAGPTIGYCRFENLKQRGVPIGGRAFFLSDRRRLVDFMRRMELEPLLIDRWPGDPARQGD